MKDPFQQLILKNSNLNRSQVPRGFKRLENKMILRSKEKLSLELGETILDTHNWCDGVFQHLTTIGENRRPELIHLAGDQNTIVIHKENGVFYNLDISKITFSGGNSGLRRELVNFIPSNHKLLDLFAAVGNLSMQVITKNHNEAILVEKDPYTYKFLKNTISLNKIENAELINKDCREIKLDNWADDIFMGYHNVDESHLKIAVKAVNNTGKIYLHPLARKNNYDEWKDRYTKWIQNESVEVSSIVTKKIKNYSPNLVHIQIVISIKK